MIFDSSSEVSLFSEFVRSVKLLERLTIFQNPSEHIPFEETTNSCPILIKETEALSKSSSSPVEVDRGSVIEKWKQYQVTPTDAFISGRDCKRFCWVPEVVSDPEFRNLISAEKLPITLPSLRGLLYCYHERFRTLSLDHAFTSKLRTMIASRASASDTIRSWNDSIDSLVGTKAPINFAKRVSTHWTAPEIALQSFGLNPTTEFAQEFASELATSAATGFGSIHSDKISGILKDIFCSQLVLTNQSAYKNALSKIILSQRASSDEEIQNLLIDFLLKSPNFGDPRMTAWAGMEGEAQSRVIEWLSREDINFFFELLLRDRDDKHGRKSFWLQYVNKISRSRALISKEDLRHHSVRLREMEDKGRSYGELVGSSTSSAFVLDFGKIVVVEFSEVGNACYIYEKQAFSELYKNFWAKEFPFMHLKNKSLVAERITRSVKDWQSSAKNILSKFGVRRG